MNIYANNFACYGKKFSSVGFESANTMLEAVRKYSDERNKTIKPTDSAPIAYIILGFSGNGKSTFIKAHAKRKDLVLSMDTTVKMLSEKYYPTPVDGNMILDTFGSALDKATSTKATLWLDGLWLNIMTRMALITTLHEYGYQVHIHSLLNEEYISKCQKARIVDECKRLYGENYTEENFLFIKRYINDFYKNERKTRYVDEQISGGYMKLHADKFIYH